MRCKRKKKHTKLKIFVAITLIIVAIFCYFDFYVNPQIVSTNTAYIKSVAIKSINEGIQETLALSDYDNLVSIEKDDSGKVNLIKVNSENANKLNCDIINATQLALESSTNMSVSIPFGTFTGIPLLNGIGSGVSIKLVPIGSSSTKFVSQFSSVAINQSCHKIFLNISATICVLLPLYTQNITVTTQVLVGECIIVGEVPSVYLNTDNLTNALNLIP